MPKHSECAQTTHVFREKTFKANSFSAHSKRFQSKSGTPRACLVVSSILLALIANPSTNLSAFAQTPLAVAGALVKASPTTGGSGSRTVATNALGLYNITTFLDAGIYTVKASANGLVDTTVQNVHVTAGQETPNVNILMPSSGRISGRITDAVSGSSLQSIIVQARSVSGSETYGSSALTDSNGTYQIYTNLATGIYNVSTTYAVGYLSKTISGISVTAGATTSNADIALDRSATISGAVTDSATSAVLPGISVYAISSSGALAATAPTNSTGKYTLNTDLGTDTYNLTIFLPSNHLPKTVTRVAIVAGNQYTVNISLDPSGIVSGRVISATNGAPLTGATITAAGGSFSGFATSNATGYYRITDGLGTTSYTVSVTYGGSLNTVMGVDVTQGQETSNVNLQLTLAPSGTITGKVTDSTGSTVATATVEANGIGGSRSTTTQSDGTYNINAGLGTGTYNVTASKLGFSPVSQIGVAVTVNQVTVDINFQLPPKASGRISGLVQTLLDPIPEFHTEFYIMLTFLIAVSTAIVLRKLRNHR